MNSKKYTKYVIIIFAVIFLISAALLLLELWEKHRSDFPEFSEKSDVIEYNGQKYSPKKDVIKDVIYFFGTSDSYETVKQESEVAEIMWVDISKVLKCVSYRNDKDLVTKAIRFYKQHKKEIIE